METESLERVIKLNEVIKVGPNPTQVMSLREVRTQTRTEGGPCADTSEESAVDKPRGGLRRSQPCPHLDLRLLAPELGENEGTRDQVANIH